MTFRKGLLSVFGLLGYAATAMDAFEYQVYDAGIDQVGQYSLETHLNDAGVTTPANSRPIKLSQNHLVHLTFEFARGMTSYWELGAYLQSALQPSGEYRYAGAKLRSKFVLPTSTFEHWRFGVNFEISNVPPQFEVDRWGAEIRPIVMYVVDRWTLSWNPIVDLSLTRGSSACPDLAPAAKVVFDMRRGYGVGLEYYSELGEINSLSTAARAEQYLLLAYDLLNGPVELNLGIGEGLNDDSNRWLAKGIFGFDF